MTDPGEGAFEKYVLLASFESPSASPPKEMP